jgi:hypothetical protein
MLPNWLPISVIAEEWSKETEQSPGLIERALVEWYSQCSYEIDPREEGDGWIDSELEEWPPTEGVSRETLMPRTYLKIMCERQGHGLPHFWFGTEGGSQSSMCHSPSIGRGPAPQGDAYVLLFDRLLAEGRIDLNSTLKDATNLLLVEKPGRKPRTVEGFIRNRFREAKEGATHK